MPVTHPLLACALLGVASAVFSCSRVTSVGAVGNPGEAGAADGGESGGESANGGSGGSGGANGGSPTELCEASGGEVVMGTCCATAEPFPNLCAVGACGCSPSASQQLTICQCVTGCFVPGAGCAGAEGACTEGADTSCNAEGNLATPRGRCITGGRCVCVRGAELEAATGRCL